MIVNALGYPFLKLPSSIDALKLFRKIVFRRVDATQCLHLSWLGSRKSFIRQMSAQCGAPFYTQVFRLFPSTRRTHTKSTFGCRECKRRKQKCSEEKPTCQSCAKRHMSCIYPAQMRRKARHINEPGSIHPSACKAVAPSIPTSIGAKRSGRFDQEDMQLWHHFITCTALTFSSPWQDRVPAVAIAHDFLMHGILAISALHLAYLCPSQQDRYHFVSAHHQVLAMSDFQLVMSAITPENCNAVFAFSTLLLIHGLIPQSDEQSKLPGTPGQGLKRVSAWVVLLRGCIALYLSAQACIESGPLGALADFHVPKAPTDNVNDRKLCRLSQHLLTDPLVLRTSSEDELETYRACIYQLRLTAAASCTANALLDYKAVMLAWAARMPDHFARLFHEHRPPALIIMSHFCMLLKRSEALWFMEGHPSAMLNGLRLELRLEWHRYLEL